MAICDLCDQEMTTARTCSVEVLHHMGTPYPVLPYGQERGWRARSGRCGDCGVRVGGFHHVGCDVQRCPRCTRQFISCGCLWDEFIHEHVDAGYLEDDEREELEALIRSAFDRLIAASAPASDEGPASH